MLWILSKKFCASWKTISVTQSLTLSLFVLHTHMHTSTHTPHIHLICSNNRYPAVTVESHLYPIKKQLSDSLVRLMISSTASL